jgi:hypothetical protein
VHNPRSCMTPESERSASIRDLEISITNNRPVSLRRQSVNMCERQR